MVLTIRAKDFGIVIDFSHISSDTGPGLKNEGGKNEQN